MIDLIVKNRESLNNICLKNNVSTLYLFGSALTESFNNTSDLDFAVEFKTQLSPLEIGESFLNLLEDLENLFDKKIDLISYRSIKNPIFKSELDKTKFSLYAAA
jgi:predicted nucleotidyltransferase